MESVELVIRQPGHADRVVRLSEGATRMGRAEDNEVVLSDGGVSRRHAQVYVSRGEVTVEDLGSGNGTYYNGYRIQSQPVQNGDEIVIDPFVLQFRIRGSERSSSGAAARDDARGSTAPARLQVVVGSGMAGASYPITSRGLSIGRSEDRDVVIADPAASRHHCQIALQGGEYVLRDMGSANGVFVNAVRVRECTLADGDLVRIGNTEMRFARYESGAGEQATARGSDQYANAPRQQSQAAQWGNDGAMTASGRETYAEAPARRKSSRPLFAMLFGGMIILVGLATILLFVVIIGVVFVKSRPWSGPVSGFAAQPPRWVLNLPNGLEPAPVDALFEQGTNKMRERDHRAALQDFYRVLQADPGYLYVDKFAFAAGEYLVLDTLQTELGRRATERAQSEAERDQALEDLRDGQRKVSQKAQRTLIRQFSDDPKVIKALNLKKSASQLALEKLNAEAATAMAGGQFDMASKLYQDVLESSKDPAARAEALAQLELAQKEVAKASAPKWSAAVMSEATGDKMNAKAQFLALKEEHPSNPSVEFHLARLP
ncbi:MAG: FHA domain-containing protein [Myxococcota bacterium]